MSNKTITSIYGEYKIIFLDEAHAREIAKWQYPSPYDFYNFHDNDETVKELLEESYYSVFDEQEELIGYLCFGSSARITTCEGFIFSDTALDAIFRYSSGTARLVNKVCTHCLLYGAQNGRRIIDEHMVKNVIQGELS